VSRAELADLKIILFDTACNLCNWSVQFVVDRDKAHIFRIASIQSDIDRELLKLHGLESAYDESVLYREADRLYAKSDAALKISRELSMPWPLWSQLALIIPKQIREWIYDKIARRRYHWFGKSKACLLPTHDLNARFLYKQSPLAERYYLIGTDPGQCGLSIQP
jgi:predicted DCC family thiol-disulfide oxidoreductase YuxK